MLSEDIIKANIKSLVNAIEHYQMTYCKVKSAQSITTVSMWYMNNDLVPGMIFKSHMMIDICDDGKISMFSVPKKLAPIIEKWLDDLLSKERQQRRASQYKMELLLSATAVTAATSVQKLTQEELI